MTRDVKLSEHGEIRQRLEELKGRVQREIREYPAPIAGCDQQFNYLLEVSDKIDRALGQLDGEGLEEAQLADLRELARSLRLLGGLLPAP